MELKDILSFKRKIQLLFEYYQEYFFCKLTKVNKIKLIRKINKIWGKLLTLEDINNLNKELPYLKVKVNEDALFAYKSDPSYKCLEETIFTSLGLYALMVYRVSHYLYKLNIDILPRVLSEWAHSKTGIDIHPGATIGRECFIDHGCGVVIGQTAIIGNNVKIYHGVTIGAKSIKTNKEKRHPTILDNVVIYANATILGGDTIIGKNCIIGTNKLITESVLENSKIV